MRVKLKDIYVGRRIRKDYGKSEMEDLINDMRENGQITAITVRPPSIDEEHEDDFSAEPWVLVAGGRRLQAAAMLGWEDIEAFARDDMTELVARTLELHENLKRKEMTWQEVVTAKAELVELRKRENPEVSDAEIARELGENPGNLSRDLQTAKLIEQHPELKRSTSKNAALNAGKIKESYRLQQLKVQQLSPATTQTVHENLVTAKAEDFVQDLATGSVDLFLCDGPYGIDYWAMSKVSGGAEGGEHHLAAYDDNPKRVFQMYEDVLPEMVRAARETGWIVFFCSTQLERHLRQLALRCCRVHYDYRDDQVSTTKCSSAFGVDGAEPCEFLAPEEIPWIWYKPNANSSSRFPHLHAANRYELILPINMGKAVLARPGCSNVLSYEVNYGKDDRIHGVQRPIEVLQELVERFSYSGDLVVDLFYGSGSTLAAAASRGRRFKGCDSNMNLREFAIGLVTKHFKPVTSDAVARSEERARRAAEGEREAPAPNRPDGLELTYELMRVGTFHLGYIKYGDYNIFQRRGSDEAELEGQLMEDLDNLEAMARLGLIDLRTATTEEIAKSLQEVAL